jgi:hypothetical protein
MEFQDDYSNSQHNDYEPTPQYEYIHFQEIKQQEVYLLNNKNIKVAHLCCGGKGIAITKKNPVRSIQKTRPATKGTCDICFMDEVNLFKTCQTCTQPFCRSCLDKIVTKICPYCRGKLCNNV